MREDVVGQLGSPGRWGPQYPSDFAQGMSRQFPARRSRSLHAELAFIRIAPARRRDPPPVGKDDTRVATWKPTS